MLRTEFLKAVLLGTPNGKGIAVSALLHACAVLLLAHSWSWRTREPTNFAGTRQVIAIEMSLAEPTAMQAAELPFVEIQPGSAQIDQQRFVDMPAAAVDWELGDIETPPLPVEPVRRAPHREAPPELLATDLPALPRASQQPPLPAKIAEPELVGTSPRTPPRFRSNRPPRYPELASQRGWEGKVILRITIDRTGRVTKVEVHRSSGYAVLDAAAVNAVRTWSGEPARVAGRPVKSVELLPVVFRK